MSAATRNHFFMKGRRKPFLYEREKEREKETRSRATCYVPGYVAIRETF